MSSATNLSREELEQLSITDTQANQYLTFLLDNEEYGVDILRVQEIRGWESPTPIPNAPEYIKGVINLRGTIIPIMDLRCRFNIEETDYTPLTVVIVLRITTATKNRTIGIVVDAVSDVYSIHDDEITNIENVSHELQGDFINGIATVDDKMMIVLEVDKLLLKEDLDVVMDNETVE